MFTGLFHYFTPEVKLSPTRKSSSFVYERLKPDRSNQIPDMPKSKDLEVNPDTEILDSEKPCSSYNTRSLHNSHVDRQIVEQDEFRERQIAPEEEYHDGRKKISWKDWLKEPQFYQVIQHRYNIIWYNFPCTIESNVHPSFWGFQILSHR